MNKSNWREATYRAGRTFIQAIVGTTLALIATGQFTTADGNAVIFNTDNAETLGKAALLSGLIAVLSWAQNALGK